MCAARAITSNPGESAMLKQPLLDQLQTLKLNGMRQALHEQLQMPDSDQLSLPIDSVS